MDKTMNPKTRNSKNKPNDPFEEVLNTLFDELKMAARWHRPSILLVSYSSKLPLWDAQISLKKKLQKIKQTVYFLDVNEKTFDIPLILTRIPNQQKMIFFVSGLSNGGGPLSSNAYRALNIRRELLVENGIRTVFWLNEAEADALPNQALDFWAFRHRKVELPTHPTPERIATLVNNLDWPYWNQQELLKEIPSGLTLREELLKTLPDWEQTPSIKAELTHTIAGLYWAKGENQAALKLLQNGLGIAQKQLSVPLVQSRFWIGIGLVRKNMGDLGQAVEAFQKALKLDPGSSEAWSNLGTTYFDQQRPTEALSAAQKSIELNPEMTAAWNNLGDLHHRSGQYDQAIQAYKKSLSINKKDAQTWVKLGDAYLSLGMPAEAVQPFKKAKQLDIKDPASWLGLGMAYRDLGLLNNAIRALYKAGRLNPISATPWKTLGDIYRYNNRLIYARKAYKTARALDPQDQIITYSLEACYLRKRKLVKT
jgi:tetratricopeptide (TPR) repeat protein